MMGLFEVILHYNEDPKMKVLEMDGYTMELLLKIPKEKEKPPVIGIIFTKVKAACEMNQELVNKHASLPYYIKFKRYSSSKGLTFELGSEKLKGTYVYKDLKYDADKLENFIYLTRHRSKFVFAHLLYDFEQFFPVSTFDEYKKFELNVERIYLQE